MKNPREEISLADHENHMKLDSVRQLQDQIRRLLPGPGSCETGIPFVKAWRFTGEEIRMPETENPYLYVILDGMLRLYTPSGIMDYMAGQYSISRIDTPLKGKVLALSEQKDFLALSVEFTVHEVISTVLEIDNDLLEKITGGTLEEEIRTAADTEVIRTVYRFFSSEKKKVFSEFLRKHIVKEMIYDLLCGSCGRQFLQSIIRIGQAEEIYQANSWIKENFRDSFTVEELAEQRNMSVSLFHQKFKSAVGMGPLQCQKRLRLTEARRLMLDENKNVTEASGEVGYESLSQFIRDYRKMFGAAPKEDMKGLRKRLEKN